MAKFNPEALKRSIIDGEIVDVPASARLADVVGPEVSSISMIDLNSGHTQLVPRSRFDMAVPAGFTTNLTPISKG